jgi:hypothetical protein
VDNNGKESWQGQEQNNNNDLITQIRQKKEAIILYQRYVPRAKLLGHVGCRLRAKMGTTQKKTIF